MADFVVQDKDGSPRIVDDVSQGSPKFSASAWVTLPYDRMSIPSNDKVTVQASLAVPQDARPGGRYIAVYFEPSIPVPQAVGSETVGQGISPRIASLLYVRVSGPITESAIISNLFAKSFYEYGPIQINAEILNRGDYHIRPRGVLTLVDPIGSTTEQTSLKEENIFPDAARAYENKLGTKWMMGRYKITLAASYGEKGQAIERSVFVWVFPWRVATVILLSIIIVILLITGMYKRLVTKESSLEEEISKEREEIEKLKEELKKRYKTGKVKDVEVKEFLFGVLEEFLQPLRARRQKFENQPEVIENILKEGTERARAEAQRTLADVRMVMKIDY